MVGERRPGAIKAGQRGFTYLGLLFLVAIMGLALTAVSEVWSTTAKREKELELLFVGQAFVQAIGDYYQATPEAAKKLPEKLEDLLEDKRSLVLLRHLRRMYVDPMTGTTDWGLIRVGNLGIAGVYSQSTDRPLRRAGSIGTLSLADAHSYQEWKFSYAVPVLATQPGITPVPPGGANDPPPGGPGAPPGGNPPPGDGTPPPSDGTPPPPPPLDEGARAAACAHQQEVTAAQCRTRYPDKFPTARNLAQCLLQTEARLTACLSAFSGEPNP